MKSPYPNAALALLMTFVPLTAQQSGEDGNGERLFKTASGQLRACGYAVPERVRLESRSQLEVLADLDAQQDALLFEHCYELQHALLSGLGLPAGKDAAQLRRDTVKSMAGSYSAYYDPLRKTFVLLPTATRDIAESLGGGLLPLVRHELVHAHQDGREVDLTAFFQGADGSLDRLMARRVVLEGEAELVAQYAAHGDEGVEALRASLKSVSLDGLLAGELAGLIYDSGRRLALARYDDSGLDAVRALWADPPRSSEQALHVLKFLADAPSEVRVPEVEGLVATRRTTAGELFLRNLLQQLGCSRLDSALAAAGWDGDLLVTFDRGEDRDVAVLWRSLWDRPADAEDFGARLTDYGRGDTIVDGRIVDWVFAEDAAVRTRVRAACDADRDAPEPDVEDAASTAAVEAELRERLAEGSTEGGFWRHEDVGLAIPIPEGWEQREFNGMQMLMPTARSQDRPGTTLNVVKTPAGPTDDLEGVLEINREQLERMQLTIDRLEIVQRGGREVIEGEYHGRIARSPEMHFLLLGYLHDDQQVYVTASVLEANWARSGARLRETLAGIRITAK